MPCANMNVYGTSKTHTTISYLNTITKTQIFSSLQSVFLRPNKTSNRRTASKQKPSGDWGGGRGEKKEVNPFVD